MLFLFEKFNCTRTYCACVRVREPREDQRRKLRAGSAPPQGQKLFPIF